MIPLTDYLNKDNSKPRILTNVNALGVDELLEQFGYLFFPDNEKNRETLISQLKKRENLGTTGIGRGFAIPHIRTLLVDKVQASIITTKGTNYNSIDNNPVFFAVSIIGPHGEINQSYLPLLTYIARFVKLEEGTKLMEDITKRDVTSEDIMESLRDYESKHCNQHS